MLGQEIKIKIRKHGRNQHTEHQSQRLGENGDLRKLEKMGGRTRESKSKDKTSASETSLILNIFIRA